MQLRIEIVNIAEIAAIESLREPKRRVERRSASAVCAPSLPTMRNSICLGAG